MNKFLADFKDALMARVESPFFSSFIISWVAINYQVLMVIFGDGKYIDKIKYLNYVLYSGREYSIYTYTLWWPLFFSLSYVLIYPWIEFGYMKVAFFYESKRQSIAINAQKQIPISEDSRKVYFEIYEKKVEALKARATELGQSLDTGRTNWMALNKVTEDRMRENVIIRFLRDAEIEPEERLIREIEMTTVTSIDYGARLMTEALTKHPLTSHLLRFLLLLRDVAKQNHDLISVSIGSIKSLVDDQDNIKLYYLLDLFITFHYIYRSEDKPLEVFIFGGATEDLERLIRLYEGAHAAAGKSKL